MVDLPLTPYVRYELEVYSENADAGEEIFITDRAAHPDLAQLQRDFTLSDDETNHPVVVWFDYSPEGRLVRYERAEDPATIGECRRQRDLVVAHAVSLNEFRSDSRHRS